METLLLNSGFEPIAKIDWQKAITLIFTGKAEIVESYEDKDIRSVSVTIKMPAVVRLLKFMRGGYKKIKFSRENVYCRDNGKCQYCSKDVTRAEATYDHVVPKSHGGKSDWTNILISCFNCNQKKANRTPEQAGMKPAKAPVKPKKLTNKLTLTLSWNKNMPLEWKDWCASVQYWNSELEE